MREIKFKVWDKQKNAWRRSEFVVMRLDGTIYEFQMGESIRTGIICQYTGLKDKNGKEIYEGDIVDFVYCKKRYVDVVVYERNNFCCENTFAPFESHLEDCEVIGNIYENPELLKGD